jgi:hypothetical protein
MPEILSIQGVLHVLPPWQQVRTGSSSVNAFDSSSQAATDQDPDYFRELNTVIREHSSGACLVILPMPVLMRRDTGANATAQQIVYENYVQQLREMTEGLPASLCMSRS